MWANPRFNELLVAARGETDEQKRKGMYAEMQQLVHDDGGMIVSSSTIMLTRLRRSWRTARLLPTGSATASRLPNAGGSHKSTTDWRRPASGEQGCAGRCGDRGSRAATSVRPGSECCKRMRLFVRYLDKDGAPGRWLSQACVILSDVMAMNAMARPAINPIPASAFPRAT
jgi:hypothetical protein